MRRLALLLLLLPLPAFAQHYEGKIDLPGRALPIQIDVDGTGAKISIPVQSFYNLALTNVKMDGGAFIADIPGIPGNPHFDGKFSADRKIIKGTFSQGGASLPFDLAQAQSYAYRRIDSPRIWFGPSPERRKRMNRRDASCSCILALRRPGF